MESPLPAKEAPYFDLAMTVEDVAAVLTVEEGRPVTVNEVRMLEMRALRKLRQALLARGRTFENLSTG